MIVKLADIYANVANTVREFDSIDTNWLKEWWLPLLDKYELNLFSRKPSQYLLTIGKIIEDISEMKKRLMELYHSKQ